ncbi:MAG: hypothetical protein DSY76_04885 [Bacteroidetes bacterium]|nr:MAG: hypothetical protein DSY76_04885 [Bacteroidota bacterium]
MKNKLLLIIIFFYFFNGKTLNAQEIKIIKGEMIKSKMEILQIVGEIDKRVYTVFYAKKNYYLRTYNKDLSVDKNVVIPMTYKDKKLEIHSLVMIMNHLYSLGQFNNKKTHKRYLLYQEHDPKTLKVIKKWQVLGEIPYEKRKRSGDFSFSYSENKKRVLIYHYLPYKKGSSQKIAFSVLDSSMNRLWHKEVTLPYTDELFAVKDFEVDDFGNVYVIGKKWKGKAVDIVNHKINFSFNILRYSEDDDQVEYKLALKDKYITQVKLAVDMQLNLICAGFYTNTKDLYSLGGSFLLKIEADGGDVVVSETKDFSTEFITSLLSKRKKEKAKKKKKKGKTIEMPEYNLDNLVIRDDGGVLLVGERDYIRTHVYTDANGTHTVYTYYSENIIVVNFNPDGTVKWMRRVPKSQSSSIPDYLSYVTVIHDDNIYFLYNDHINNAKVKRDEERGHFNVRASKSNLVAYRINSDGETEYLPLFAAANDDTLVVPNVSKQLKESQDVILYSDYGKRQRLYRIEFED